MKKSLFVIGLALIFAVPAFAELTNRDAYSRDYLDNHGYSPALVNAVEKSVAQVSGEPLEEPIEREYYNKPFIKFVRRVYMWIDPAVDDHSFMNDHKIRTTPRYDDL